MDAKAIEKHVEALGRDASLHPEVLPVVEGVHGVGCPIAPYDSLDVTPGRNSSHRTTTTRSCR